MKFFISYILDFLKQFLKTFIDLHTTFFKMVLFPENFRIFGMPIGSLLSIILGLIFLILILLLDFKVIFDIQKIIYNLFKKRRRNKILRYQVTGRILRKSYTPSNTRYKTINEKEGLEFTTVNSPTSEYNITVVYNGKQKTFNNQEIFFKYGEKSYIPLIMVKRIDKKGNSTIDLELPE